MKAVNGRVLLKTHRRTNLTAGCVVEQFFFFCRFSSFVAGLICISSFNFVNNYVLASQVDKVIY
jgi:hypothetical protein